MIKITTGDSRPIFQQIVDDFRLRIVSGELSPNTKLPSVRALAMQLTVNPNTVAKAYGRLTAEGLIETRNRVGVFVCEPKAFLSDVERGRRLDEATERFVSAVAALGFSEQDILRRLADRLSELSLHEREP